MKFTKIVSLMLVAVLALTCLASCEMFAASAVKKADKALAQAPYTVNVAMEFSSDDKDINEAFSTMEAMDISIAVDGKNSLIEMAMNMDSVSMDIDYTIIENTLYLKTAMTLLGKTQTVKYQSTITEDDRDELLGTANAASEVGFDDFSEIAMENKDGSKVITCTGLSKDETDDLEEMIADQLESIKAKVTVKNVKYIITIKDGKYEKIELLCDYEIVAGDESYEIGMKSTMTYDYESKVEISAPSDASSYEKVDFDEIVG